jgi:ADP-heptose:LPS heptosyltransferase
MRILVAQQTRMGDMLQTSPLIHALKLQHPDAHITVLVRHMAKVVAEHHPDVDEVLIYDEEEMFCHMRSGDSDEFLRAYQLGEEHVNALKAGRFDVVYNCTHSIASAMLFKLAGIPKVIGARMSDEWRYILEGRWVNYFYTSILLREYNALNLCESIRGMAEGAPECCETFFRMDPQDREFADALLADSGVQPDDRIVCMQLGASQDNKRWPVEQFAALAKRLHAEGDTRIFLLGVEEERSLGETFAQHEPDLAVPLYGQTSIPQLAALLERATVLVSNDTGTMHIAAAVKCPTVLVSVGAVHFRETGPFGAGHMAIERRREILGSTTSAGPSNDSRIEPDHVLTAMNLLTAGSAHAQLPDADEYQGVNLYRSNFAEDGFLEWYPVVTRPMERSDYLRMAYRAMWIEFLQDRAEPAAEHAAMTRALACYAADTDGTRGSWSEEACKNFAALATLAKNGITTTQHLLDILTGDQGYAAARVPAAALMQLDEDTRVFGEVHAELKPLVLNTRYARDNLEGMDPLYLAQETLRIYGDLERRAELMQEKLKRIVDCAREAGNDSGPTSAVAS